MIFDHRVSRFANCASRFHSLFTNNVLAGSSCSGVCPPSPSSESSWQAIVGFYGAVGSAATRCPANNYCEAGTERPIACPSGTQSTELANDITDCVSSPGYYGPNGRDT